MTHPDTLIPRAVVEQPSYDMSLHSNPDAQAWAKFFIKTQAETGFEIDEALMLSWFANAMMAMHDYLKQSKVPAIEEIRGAVARGWCTPENSHKVMDATLALAIADSVCAALQAQPTSPVGQREAFEAWFEAEYPVESYGRPKYQNSDVMMLMFAAWQAAQAQPAPFQPDWANYNQGREDGKAEALEEKAAAEPCFMCHGTGEHPMASGLLPGQPNTVAMMVKCQQCMPKPAAEPVAAWENKYGMKEWQIHALRAGWSPQPAPDVQEAVRLALEIIRMQRDWIMAVPQETQLPAMPGFDRDWVDDRIAALEKVMGK